MLDFPKVSGLSPQINNCLCIYNVEIVYIHLYYIVLQCTITFWVDFCKVLGLSPEGRNCVCIDNEEIVYLSCTVI